MKADIWTRHIAIKRQESRERREALQEHNAKFEALFEALQSECEAAGGHKMELARGEFAMPGTYLCQACGYKERR